MYIRIFWSRILLVVCFRESAEMEATEGNEQEDEDNDGIIHTSAYDMMSI